jgi:hypothetical protein
VTYEPKRVLVQIHTDFSVQMLCAALHGEEHELKLQERMKEGKLVIEVVKATEKSKTSQKTNAKKEGSK